MKTHTGLILSCPLVMLAFASPALAQDVVQPSPQTSTQIDYAGFTELTLEVAELRSERLLGREDFFARAATGDAVVLDTRSAAAFRMGHIAGAVNLPFSDFTQDKLKAVLGGDMDRPILIYCNNNFTDDAAPVASKLAPLALNIPTFINLVGYGYTNVWELGDTMKTAEVDWVGEVAVAP
ncbi:MAG: rhodanese-like domain-containing protein [Erythrobacter sp.]